MHILLTFVSIQGEKLPELFIIQCITESYIFYINIAPTVAYSLDQFGQNDPGFAVRLINACIRLLAGICTLTIRQKKAVPNLVAKHKLFLIA
jgi:hypothetical protein